MPQEFEIVSHPRPRPIFQKDGYFSPGHALFINGFLIPVKDLVNGTSVVPAMPTDMETIEYFQIVFDTHEVIWAEGVPAETFAANDKTAYEVFTNFVEYERLYPADSYAIAPLSPISVQSGRI
jgi:Hint domain